VKAAIRGLLAGVLLLATVVTVGLATSGDAGSKGQPANNVLAKAVDIELGREKAGKLPQVSGGTVQAVLDRMGIAQEPGGQVGSNASTRGANNNDNGDGAHVVWRNSKGCPNTFRGSVDNIRVNQDCSLRRQAEEWIGVNPRDFDNITAGQNDSLIGFNHCGYDFSFDRGKSWASVGTSPPPFWQELFVTNDTADACSDPAGTFDHLGNAYVTGVFFEVADVESSIWVAKSNWPNGGAFYHEPRQVDAFQEYRTAVMGQPASDADPNIFHDKELMVADSRSTSPKKGRVYVTWTRFQALPAFPFQISPIVFSQSTDGGATWSPAVVISGVSSALCTDFSATPDACDQDQGSHPVVGPDGTIYVIFGNGNTPDPGINQVLFVRCPPTNNCDSSADWEGPFRVGDLIGTHPFGPAAAGCPGRQCLPPNGYRVPEFTSMSVSVDKNSNLYAIWADHRNNTNPNCDFRTSPPGNGLPPCDHDVFYSFSTDRGTTWSPTVTVTPRSRLGENAQWQPWHDVSGDGSKVYAAFYDRHYGNCETTGCNDITLATISRTRSANPSIQYKRITTASMPNLIPANNPLQAGFLGDYMWVEVSHHNFNQKDVHIVWADTRPLPYRLSHQRFPEEDIYYAQIDGGGDDDDDD
jgi:hypothetical protein